MKAYYILPILLHLCCTLQGQINYDQNWIIGYDNSALDLKGQAIQINFKNSPVVFQEIESLPGLNLEGTNTIMSDRNGELLFFSNGCYIVNADHEIMFNGHHLAHGLLDALWCSRESGNPTYQGAVSIPSPESDSIFYMFNLDFEEVEMPMGVLGNVAPLHLYAQKIDMSKDNGLGAVVERDMVIVEDTLSRSGLQAVQHANGKDWWVIMPEFRSNCFYIIKIDENGIGDPKKQCEGLSWTYVDFASYSTFSPDMKTYIRHNNSNGMNVFDFDNSLGELSFVERISFPFDTFPSTAGVAISPNSRFAYATAFKKAYQFDLKADSIASSKVLVAEWDSTYNPYASVFNFAALAPNGKIYISSTSSHLNLHVIHSPDSAGLSCDFEQNGVNLPIYNYVTLPNIPHFKEAVVQTQSEKNLGNGLFKIYPNPSKGRSIIQYMEGSLPSGFSIKFFDTFGVFVFEKRITSSTAELDLSKLKSGIKFFFIYDKNKNIVQSGKFLLAG